MEIVEIDRNQKQNKLSPGQRTTWQADTRVRVSNTFNIFLMDEPQEYFSLLVAQLAFVVVATGHVAGCFGKTNKMLSA